MNEFLQKLKNLVVKYREWSVVFLLLGGIIYFLSLYQDLTKEQVEGQILGGAGPARSEEDELSYDEIVDKILVVPTPYVDLVKFNPFIPIEDVLEIQRKLRERFNEGRRLYDAGNYLDAREVFQQLLQTDPYEAKIDYKPYKPNTYIRRCEQEAERQEIRGFYNQGVDLFERAKSLEAPESGVSEEELLRVYEDCRTQLQKVVERGQKLLPEAVEDSKRLLGGSDEHVGVEKRVNELRIITFTATLTRMYDDAVDFWNRREENLANVANANDNLHQAQAMIAEYPGEFPESALQVQDQIVQLLEEIEKEIERRYPSEQQKAAELESAAQGNLDRLSQAFAIYEVLYRLRKEDDIKETMDRLRKSLDELERLKRQERTSGWLQQARDLLKKAGDARDQGDWEALEVAQKDGLTVLDQFDGLPETPELVQVRADAANLRAEFENLAVPSLITGYVLSRASARSAILLDVATKRRIFLSLGKKDPRSGITYKQPGEADATGRIVSIVIEKDGFRPTEIRLEQP